MHFNFRKITNAKQLFSLKKKTIWISRTYSLAKVMHGNTSNYVFLKCALMSNCNWHTKLLPTMTSKSCSLSPFNMCWSKKTMFNIMLKFYANILFSIIVASIHFWPLAIYTLKNCRIIIHLFVKSCTFNSEIIILSDCPAIVLQKNGI